MTRCRSKPEDISFSPCDSELVSIRIVGNRLGLCSGQIEDIKAGIAYAEPSNEMRWSSSALNLHEGSRIAETLVLWRSTLSTFVMNFSASERSMMQHLCRSRYR